jgi:hypothetical protein
LSATQQSGQQEFRVVLASLVRYFIDRRETITFTPHVSQSVLLGVRKASSFEIFSLLTELAVIIKAIVPSPVLGFPFFIHAAVAADEKYLPPLASELTSATP